MPRTSTSTQGTRPTADGLCGDCRAEGELDPTEINPAQVKAKAARPALAGLPGAGCADGDRVRPSGPAPGGVGHEGPSRPAAGRSGPSRGHPAHCPPLGTDQLDHRSPEELRLRAELRWHQRYSHLAGPDISQRADRLAYDLLAPSGCEVARCEKGWVLDDSGGCHRCRTRRAVVDTAYEPAPAAMREAEAAGSAAEPASHLGHDREVQRLAGQKERAASAARATEKGNQS